MSNDAYTFPGLVRNYLLLRVNKSPVFSTQANKVDWKSQVIHVVCDPSMRRQGLPLDPVIQHNNAVLQMYLHDLKFDHNDCITIISSTLDRATLCHQHDVRFAHKDLQSRH